MHSLRSVMVHGFVIGCVLATVPGLSLAQERSALTGDWFGVRNALDSAGITVRAFVRSDNGYNIHGGACPGGGHIRNLDVGLAWDASPLLGFHGTSLLLRGIAGNGGSISRHVGDVQMVSNIEGYRGIKLYEAWAQQEFDGWSFLAGLYDLNTEFYVTPSSALFLNGSFGVGSEFSHSGLNGPSIYPSTGLAARVRWTGGGPWYAQGVVLDGMPGNESDPCAPSFDLRQAEGALLVGEAGVDWGDRAEGGKFAVGAWRYTQPVGALGGGAEEGMLGSANEGAYLLAEWRSRIGRAEGGSTLQMFVRFGISRGGIFHVDGDLGVGVVLEGVFAREIPDAIGVAFTAAHRTVLDPGSVAATAAVQEQTRETAIEVTYRAFLAPWLALQPDIQHIIHPGFSRLVRNGTVVGCRVEVEL